MIGVFCYDNGQRVGSEYSPSDSQYANASFKTIEYEADISRICP